MTRMVIAGNWKMHHGPSAARKFFEEFSPNLAKVEPRIVIFPPAISLLAAAESRRGRPEVELGIQNIHWQPKGAFTGEHSARMAMVAGARYALVGHSERRHVFGETDAESSSRCQRRTRGTDPGRLRRRDAGGATRRSRGGSHCPTVGCRAFRILQGRCGVSSGCLRAGMGHRYRGDRDGR